MVRKRDEVGCGSRRAGAERDIGGSVPAKVGKARSFFGIEVRCRVSVRARCVSTTSLAHILIRGHPDSCLWAYGTYRA